MIQIRFNDKAGAKKAVKKHCPTIFKLVSLVENIFTLEEVAIQEDEREVFFSFNSIRFRFHTFIQNGTVTLSTLKAMKNGLHYRCQIKTEIDDRLVNFIPFGHTTDHLSNADRTQLQFQRVVEYVCEHIEKISTHFSETEQTNKYNDLLRKFYTKTIRAETGMVTIYTEELSEEQIRQLVEKYQEIVRRKNG